MPLVDLEPSQKTRGLIDLGPSQKAGQLVDLGPADAPLTIQHDGGDGRRSFGEIASGLAKRFGKQFWNKTIAQPVQELTGGPEEVLGDKAYIIQQGRRKQRKAAGQKDLPHELLNDEYEDIKRQLALPARARDDDDLQTVEYQYQPQKPSLGAEVTPAETIGQKRLMLVRE